MAGIYIHIPFCKKKCTYCDFYTEVAPKLVPSLVNSLTLEIELRRNYLQNAPINTIYFGGGTPSILKKEEFESIFDTIYSNYNVNENAEITFEANPDDLSTEFFSEIKQLPFNRISIGIQSFDDADLKRINRRHNAEQALNAVREAQQAGFNNISIDLIYGLPGQTLADWERQIDTALTLNVQHISSYGLTYEEGTALWIQRKKGKVDVVMDETMNEMHELLLEKVTKSGFDAYEISNFALPGFRSRHNSAYWKQEPYLGIGPSAHSFDIDSRQWNVASITKYIEALSNNTLDFEREILTKDNRYNDYVMVSLRTSDGIDLTYLEKEFGTDYTKYCMQNIKSFIETNKVIQSGQKLRLSNEGIQISNLILIEIMRV